MKLPKLLFLFVLYGGVLHAQSNTWKMFENDQFKIQFPFAWKVNEITTDLKNMGIEFMAMSDKEDSKDKFQENLNLLVENIKDATTDLKTYAQKSEDAIKKSVTGLKMFHKKNIVLQSGECTVFQYHGKAASIDLFWYQVMWVKNSKAYVLTLTSDEKSHWDFKRAFEVIALSFVIK